MAEHLLTGCTPEPLMGYLKTLGLFRLVAEQADPDARLAWDGNAARLVTRLDESALLDFLLNEYVPTPVLAPWNGGSGFFGSGGEAVGAVEQSTAPRLEPFRATIAAIRTFIPTAKPKDEDKVALLERCRNLLPDSVVPWLDACYVLGEEKPYFFPLLGTGGNDGRLDFTNNFQQRLLDVLGIGPKPVDAKVRRAWAESALFGRTLVSLGKTAVGQFNPGGIGGANGIQGKFEADARVNPWDFVLMIEGALLCAGSVSRRLGGGGFSRAVFPFSVDSVAVGYGSSTASEETSDGSRAELWMPLWDRPASVGEVRKLFAEGRAQLGRRQARNAVEFALAVNLLGVNRGVREFVRFGFLKRNGLAFLAAPLGRVVVRARPAARLLDDPPLTDWRERLRRACADKDKTPSRYQSALRQFDRAVFEFAGRSEVGGDRRCLVEVLRAIGRAERTLSGGLKFAQDKRLRPLADLSPQWFDQADDGSPEFELAASLATLRRPRPLRALREFIEPTQVTAFVNWNPGDPNCVWSNRSLDENLAAVWRRRRLDAFQSGVEDYPNGASRPAGLDAVLAFLRGDTDDKKLEELLWGLMTAGRPGERELQSLAPTDELPFEFGLVRLVAQTSTLTPRGDSWNLAVDANPNVRFDGEVFHALSSGRRDAVETAATRAARRLRVGGLSVVGYVNRAQAGRPLAIVSPLNPVRLLAACLFPLALQDLQQIARIVLSPNLKEE